jgi:hypothetical protein
MLKQIFLENYCLLVNMVRDSLLKEFVMSMYEKVSLHDIDGNNNIRRASPLLQNKGIDLLNICQTQGLGMSQRWWVPFLETVSQDSRLLSLSRSLAITGQIHPITLLKENKRYRCISGQRRYIAMVILECLRNVIRFGKNEEVQRAREIFNKDFPEMLQVDFVAFEKNENELTINAEIKEGVIPEEAERIAFSANEEAETMNDIDWSNWINKFLGRDNPKTGTKYTLEDSSKICGKSVWWLKQRQNLLHLPKEWQEKLDYNEITIGKAAAYAADIVKGTIPTETVISVPAAVQVESEEEVAAPIPMKIVGFNPMAAPVASKEQKDIPQNTSSTEESDLLDSIDFSEDEEVSESDAPAPVVRDWTEGKRKTRTAKPKMMKYEEVIELLQSLEPHDEHGIDLLAQILKMPIEEATSMAGTTAGKI